MGSRFKALSFLANLQMVVGVTLVVIGCVFAAVVLSVPTGQDSAKWTSVGIAVGMVLVGVQLMALAQVYQCLMQIEINTRPPQGAEKR